MREIGRLKTSVFISSEAFTAKEAECSTYLELLNVEPHVNLLLQQ
jgi:hypothetical protein